MAGSVTYILARADKLGANRFQTSHTLPRHYTNTGRRVGGSPATTLSLYDKFPKHPEKKSASRQSFVQKSHLDKGLSQ